MAVVEIAKIQVRRGQENQTGVPQLDGGEFAWAADTEKLYIGLRRDDGGSRDANVEILTENHLRNFFELNRTDETYIYREGSTSSRVLSITAEEGTADEWERTIREKLDDTVHITDFGVVPDSPSWDLRRLQLAIDRLFLNTGAYTTDPAKELFFPAGVYDITGTVYIPARTTIVGEGIGKTIFNFTANESAMFQTCDISSVGGTTGYKHFDSGAGNGADFTEEAKNIRIENVTVQFSTGTTATEGGCLIKLDNASNSIVRNIEFKGQHTTNSGILSAFDYSGITLRASTTGTHDNSLIENCQFRNLYHGVLSNHSIRGTLIQNNDFYDLARGITFNDYYANDFDLPIPDSQTGPIHVKVLENKFDNIEQEALYVGENENGDDSYITSQNNYFGRNVGNHMTEFGNRSQTGTAIVLFATPRNISIADHFERLEEQNRWGYEGEVAWFNPIITGNTTIDNFYVDSVLVEPGLSPTTVLRLPITNYDQHIDIKYSAFKVNANDYIHTVVMPSSTVTVDDTSTYTYSAVETTSTGAYFYSTTTSMSTVLYLDDVTGIVEYSSLAILIEEGSDIVNGMTITNYIPTGTEVIGVESTDTTFVSSSTSVTGKKITLNAEVAMTATSQILFRRPVDRMGNVRIYLQDGSSPRSTIVDDYNFVRDEGGIVFTLQVDATNKYYEIQAKLDPVFVVPITIEYNTKLMQ